MTTITLSAVIHREDDWLVAECPEIGTASQGRTVEEALANLREATELYLEEMPEAVAGSPTFLTTFSVRLPDAAAA
ncbi:MAG TPA: type II toxin-antitoxin system HicB family antitoxin [Geminicoccus sp.]|nr:type II toxin-antitoxin system HicB family antitoxin [Geminicoccus sp.]